MMLNHFIWLNAAVYSNLIMFLILFTFFCVVVYFLFFSIKDLIVDYLPDLLHTISMWKNIFLVLGVFLMVIFFNFQ